MEYLKDWNRETSVLFASMVIGSWVWVVSERLFLGALAGVFAHFALTALYQSCARIFKLPHLSYVRDFEREYLPLILRVMPRVRTKRRV